MRPLLKLVGLDAAECERRMQLLGFGEADRQRLVHLSPFLESIADDMVEVFYHRILSIPDTARFLEDPVLVASLKKAQRRHYIELVSGTYDADYFESRLRVGMTHARIRLDPNLYLTGYLVQISFTTQRLFEHFGEDVAAAGAAVDSLAKILMLDIALATEAYIYGGFVERSTADLRAYETVLAQEALSFRLREEAKREELLRMVVHDVRSPVAAIIATARAALRRFRDVREPPGKQFALLEATGQNVLQIIDNMVSHARAPGGELPLAAEPFDVAEVVSACVAQLMPFAQQTGHVIRPPRLECTPSTRLDKSLVRRIVSNLLMNACRHTPAGCSIDVECGVMEDWCSIIVADNGPGLPTTMREALVGEAALLPRPDAGAYVDSGLGLPFCRMACERMGGRLELGPKAKFGTRFVVRLPLGLAI
ncbi:MAG TPA: protoglobin domain-containing protein [Candidatus Binatia bacterium]